MYIGVSAIFEAVVKLAITSGAAGVVVLSVNTSTFVEALMLSVLLSGCKEIVVMNVETFRCDDVDENFVTPSCEEAVGVDVVTCFRAMK